MCRVRVPVAAPCTYGYQINSGRLVRVKQLADAELIRLTGDEMSKDAANELFGMFSA